MEDMKTTKQEILEFVEENDVKFIRLVFCDLFGTQKNISIMAEELEEALNDGIAIDASSILGFTEISNADLLLRPDPTTLSFLPWRPQQGRVAKFYCSILEPNGQIYGGDSREILIKAVDKCRSLQYECKMESQCEFYLFKTDEDGEPTNIPQDKGGYLDLAPLDRGENVRREICYSLEDMGLHPESSHHEQGPGQNEIDFMFAEALTAADDFMSFKTTVKAVALQNGLFASFKPKPLADECGSGNHINISLYKKGKNIFDKNNEDYRESESFMAGILEKAREMTLFLNPVPNSYERLGKFEAPEYVTWSESDRSQFIRIPTSKDGRCRMELRASDPAINPYLVYALLIEAGLYGIRNKLTLPKATNMKALTTEEKSMLEKLPMSLEEAIEAAKDSAFIKEVIGEEELAKYIAVKENPKSFSKTYYEYM